MPILGKTFDTADSSSNPKVLDLFIKYPAKAYSLAELQKKFGDNVIFDLWTLQSHGRIESKFINDDWFYRLKKRA